jgi:hypothetical protein
MNEETLKEKWPEICWEIKERWEDISDKDLCEVNEDEEKLFELIKKKTRFPRGMANAQVCDLIARYCTNG